ncbi:hypothetical protein QYM36_011789 [Artemia franciscana]|uniref:Endonuclease/exonuclease/phosphatase domain-containing protein n=1 Tax=Artemia franciscana TaxID=6661 RepID=A0AA88HPE1_ARTSF|nr:hypothetical protein QYM36_011789 [Artemia franciscana]
MASISLGLWVPNFVNATFFDEGSYGHVWWEARYDNSFPIHNQAMIDVECCSFSNTIVRDATEKTKDDFYGELQQLSSSIAARDYLIVAGDFNARVGPSDQTTRQILGKFGQGHICENGKRLVNYALMNHLVITNTIFQRKPSHLLTWNSNVSVTKAQIDFILARQRWRSAMQDSRSYSGADTGSQSGSDHRLVAAKILLRLAIRRKNKPKVGFGIDLIGLKVSKEKTKFMAINHDTGPFPLAVNEVQVEKVNRFTYLGSQLCTDGSSDADIQQRIQKV